jgi:hypothetical protein
MGKKVKFKALSNKPLSTEQRRKLLAVYHQQKATVRTKKRGG